MGIYFKDSTKYIVKYNDKNFNDLKEILEKTLNYFYNDECQWEYITDWKKIYDRYSNDEYGYNLDDRKVELDSKNKLLSIEGIFEREHGEGTDLTINEDYLLDELFKYDPNIKIIEESVYETDYDTLSNDESKLVIFMFNNEIYKIQIDYDIEIIDFDRIVEESDMKYFTVEKDSKNTDIIQKNIKNIYPKNSIDYYNTFKDYLREEDIIVLIKIDFYLINYVDQKIVDKVLNDKTVIAESLKNTHMYYLSNDFDEELIDIIISNKECILEFLNKDDRSFRYVDEDSLEERIVEHYKNDRDIMLALIKKHNYSYINLIDKFKTDKEIIKEAVNVDKNVWKFVPKFIKNDEAFVKELEVINKDIKKIKEVDRAKVMKRLEQRLKKKQQEETNDSIVQLSLFEDKKIKKEGNLPSFYYIKFY